jgi:glycosyltransferase involved in cell wall biosynthesis
MSYRVEPSVASRLKQTRVALMLPCLNEELTLAQVIRDFKNVLPSIEVYVFDNCSTDRSVAIAHEEGARVVRVTRRGKGHVVRKMFESVEADIYVMVDSDDTYDAKGLLRLIEPVLDGEVDMVVGSRLAEYSASAFRKFHRFGNSLIIRLINFIFGSQFTDILSGYRVMSRQFVKNIPFMRDGFEVETELTVYSLIYGFSVKEMPLPYRHRPPNSHSKLRTFSDGYKVLLTIVWLARDLRPLLFFALSSVVLFTFVALPLRVFSPDSLFWQLTVSFVSIALAVTGLILNSVHIRFQELQVLARRASLPKEMLSQAPSLPAIEPRSASRLSA